MGPVRAYSLTLISCIMGHCRAQNKNYYIRLANLRYQSVHINMLLVGVSKAKFLSLWLLLSILFDLFGAPSICCYESSFVIFAPVFRSHVRILLGVSCSVYIKWHFLTKKLILAAI